MKIILTLISIATLFIGNFAFAEERTMSDFYAIAKENCQDIPALRIEINRINDDILRLLAERTAYVKRAGDIKFKTTQVANDPARIAAQEQILIEKSIELEVPLEISIPTFRAIVENSTKYQQTYIDQLIQE